MNTRLVGTRLNVECSMLGVGGGLGGGGGGGGGREGGKEIMKWNGGMEW